MGPQLNPVSRRQKKPRHWRGYTGFCCCRESGLGACVSLWWFIVVVVFAASSSISWFLVLLVGFFWLRCLVADVELAWRAEQRPFLCR
jgi:hypothetical protein